MTRPEGAHWNGVARAWRHWESPLRPAPADIRILEEVLRGLRTSENHDALRVLLWGVTPEIAEMAWPERTELLAVDRAADMIESIWPGNIAGQRRAVCAEWLEYPTEPKTYDAVVGDGVFTLLSFPIDYRALASQAHRVLNDDGILMTRLFVLPAESESPETVLEDLHALRIGNFHIFKFRLAMAVQTSPQEGVRMGDVFDAWNAAGMTMDDLATATGWTREAIGTIEHYRDEDSRLSFPTLPEFHTALADEFELIDCRFPKYEMGERCPIVCYRARPRGKSP